MFGTPNQIQALKENFGMGNLSHADDVAKTRKFDDRPQISSLITRKHVT